MQMVARFALLGAFALSPALAAAQGLYTLDSGVRDDAVVVEEPVFVEEPALVVREPVMVRRQAVVVEQPVVYGGPITEQDAVAIAMANGIVAVEDVHKRWIDGDYEVDGDLASGQQVEVRIDADSGAVLSIDD